MLALLLLAFTAYRGWNANRKFRAEMASAQKATGDLLQKRHELEAFFNRPDNRIMRDRAAFLNGLIEQRSFPWTKIFMDLERSLPPGVRVVSISPRMNAGRVEVKLTIGATSDEGTLKFLRALENSREFSHIELLSETRPARPDQSDRIILELSALYSTTT